MIILKRRIFSGYSETPLAERIDYINSQLKQGGEYLGDRLEDLGDGTSEYILDPISNTLQKVEELPVIREVKPKSISRYKKLTNSLSRLLKKKKRDNKNNK